MKTWWVCSPEFGRVIPILDDGTGPIEPGADVITIEAETKRDALVLGVKAMSEDHRSYSYCRDQRDSGLSPFEGVTVQLAMVTLCGSCHHEEGEHDEDACRGGEDIPCKCSGYWPEGEDEE